MRILVLPLSALAIALTVSAQSSPNTTTPSESGALYLPATLSKTLRSEKTHPGDAVKLRLNEPVLVGHGLVIPEGAVLRGRVTQANGLEGEHASRLAILVDTAEWKHQKFPLHASISGVVKVREVSLQKSTDWRCGSPDERRGTRLPGEAAPVARPSPVDCKSGMANPEVNVVRERGADLKEVLIRRNHQDGSTVLFSHKKNVHLKGGIVLMLRNVSPDEQSSTTIVSQK
jgi:hypothetical protein